MAKFVTLHRASGLMALAVGLTLSLSAHAQTGFPASASSFPPGAVVQPLPDPNDPEVILANNLKILASNPYNVDALLAAGQGAINAGDPNAAIGFLARAEELSPRNGRVKAALGSALIAIEKPTEALRMFGEATALGIPEYAIAKDRGLAWDLRGDPARAQADYALALKGYKDDEITRRYALSLANSGKKDVALKLLDPLTKKGDQAAWRARAFVYAMNGEQGEADKIIRAVMAPNMAGVMTPFLQQLPRLNFAQRAQAVNFGTMPAVSAGRTVLDPGDSFRSVGNGSSVGLAQAVEAKPNPARDAPQETAKERKAREKQEKALAKIAARNRPNVPVARPAAVRIPVPPAVKPAPQPVKIAVAPPTPQPARPLLGPSVLAPTKPVAQAPVAVAVAQALKPEILPPSPVASPVPAPVPVPAPSPVPTPVPLATQSPFAIPPVGPSTPSTLVTPPAITVPPAASPLPEVVKPVPAPVVAAPTPSPTPTPSPASTPAPTLPTVSIPAPGFEAPKPVAVEPAPQPIIVEPAIIVPKPVVPTPAVVTPTPAPIVVPPVPAPTELAGVTPAPVGPASPFVIPPPEPMERVPSTGLAETPVAVPPEPVAAATPEPQGLGSVLSDIPVEAESAAGPLPTDEEFRKRQLDAKRKEDARKKADIEAKAKDDAAEKEKLAKDAAAKREAEEKAAELKRNPSRIWVQIATGANRGALGFDWKRLRGKAPKALEGQSAWTAPLRATNRLLIGPFKSNADARAKVNALAKEGIQANAHVSDTGQEVTRLGGK